MRSSMTILDSIRCKNSHSSIRRTKIIATAGPASSSPERIRQLIEAGVNVFRLNFSHGTHDRHLEVLRSIREISGELGRPVGVLQDLSGPKIRISEVDETAAQLRDGQKVEICHDSGARSSNSRIFVQTIDPAAVLKPGHQVLMADGLISLRTEEVRGNCALCVVEKASRLRSHVGIAFPDSVVDLPATTDKDLIDLQWGIKHGVDFAAVSFVRSAQDILRLREILKQSNSEIQLISKIERKDALDNVHELMDVSDGIMVARGDLGLELPLECLPIVQKALIRHANFRGIPVIVATQMMHSMITSVRPTRAEVSDIAAAVMTGADCLMLSEETAIGEHPLECVKYLNRIALEAENDYMSGDFKLALRDSDRASITDAAAYAAVAAASKIRAAALVVRTESGYSARLMAKYRPTQPIYGVSSHPDSLRRMAIYWGVTPLACTYSTLIEEIRGSLSAIQAMQNPPKGSTAVITGNFSKRAPAATTLLDIREFESGV